MRYKLRKYNINFNLEEINFERVEVVHSIFVISTVIGMILSFLTRSPLADLVIVIACVITTSLGLLTYFAKIKQTDRYVEFKMHNYIWIFNTIMWLMIFLLNIAY